MKLSKIDLGEYFLINVGDKIGKRLGRFIGKDDAGNVNYLFEYYDDLGNMDDRDGHMGENHTLVYGSYGKYGFCRYSPENKVIKKIPKDEAMVELL
jgi:hypothetical protein